MNGPQAPPFSEPSYLSRLPGSVLFSCTNNALRSPMAEALMRRYYGRQVHVDSAGVRTAEVDGFSIAVMEEIGVDIAEHQAKTFGDLDGAHFDLVISLSPEARHSAMELTRHMNCETVFWNTFDPSVAEGNREMRLEAYREVRRSLDERIRGFFPPLGSPGI